VTSEMHPQTAKVLELTEQFRAQIDDQLRRAITGKFTATDEAETVTVILTAQGYLTSLHIDDELPRLGADTVAQRVNEAIENARAAALARAEIDGDQLLAALTDIAGQLQPMAEQVMRSPGPENWT
jgi:DNA-binding protein YbaB